MNIVNKAYNRICNDITGMIFKRNSVAYLESESAPGNGETRFAHVTYPAVSNAGDTVLSACVRKIFNDSCNVDQWSLIHVKAPVDESCVTQINGCKKLIIGGGGLFLPDTNSNNESGWQWAISKEQLEQISTPVCVYSVGYNYFRGQECSEMFVDNVNRLAEKSFFFGLRNNGSVNAIRSILDENIRDKVCYQPCTTTLIRKLYDNIPQKIETRKIALNMAFDRENLRFGENKEVILKSVAKAMKIIVDTGKYELYYVSHCWADRRFIEYLKQENVQFTEKNLSYTFPNEVVQFYSGIDVVIGMRGHAQMIPFGLNCEIISLGTHEKMKWFLEDIECTDWYVELNDVDDLTERIVNKFSYVHEENADLTRKRLTDAQEKLWDISVRNMNSIKALNN